MESTIIYRNLILLAVVPAIILLIKVYQKDKVEKESPKMLVTLIMCGIFFCVSRIAGGNGRGLGVTERSV